MTALFTTGSGVAEGRFVALTQLLSPKEIRMRHIVILALSVFFYTTTAGAQAQPEPRALAAELLTINNVQQNVERVFAQVKQIQIQQLESLELPPERAEEAEQLQEKLLAVLGEELSWESMKEEYIAAYTEVFTPEELQALLDFSRSEAGRGINAKMPRLMEKTMQIGQRRAQQALPRMQEILNDFFADESADQDQR
ncbi:DUF2059 domain-containing protein [Geoalkalibacter sp.]|uniref:DUF2059 domain-containing protein n=1 Tax=Geoalkalibacter sp. TaxID=3041440 RepID=UPI00272DF0F9|nr:DUF2059 domain-containing protein [Geoalkalibacter sp.]